jgi:hypothetical protein
MAKDLEQHLALALQRLEKAYGEILKTQGYTKDSEKLKLLMELTREQVKNENTDNSNRQTR